MPSDVLADQLRLRATYEREIASKNVTAKRLSAQTGAGGGAGAGAGTGGGGGGGRGGLADIAAISGPPLAAVGFTGAKSTATNDNDDSQVKVASPKPVLSGSLLSGRRNASASGAGGGAGPGSRNIGPAKPIFEQSFSGGGGSVSETYKRGTGSDENSVETSSNATVLAAKRAVVTGHAGVAPIDKRETIQCTYCLRRFPRLDMTRHSTACELRTEICPNGCGAKVRAIKMEVHMRECPKR